MWAGVIPGLRTLDNPTLTRANLTMWGVEDEREVFEGLIGAFQSANPGVKITYEKKRRETYEEDLLRAFAAGMGPDIFNVHHLWLLKYRDILGAAPERAFPFADFRSSFADVVQRDFTSGGSVYGVALYVDTLALYFNVDLFNSAGLPFPPKDWDEFAAASRKLTLRKQSGDIQISGAAMGSGRNVVDSADILELLMLQYGVPLVDQNGRVSFKSAAGVSSQGNAAERAFEFYTSFAKQGSPNYSWSGASAGTSEDLFAQNKAGMMVGYASARERLLRKSPRLKFEVAPLPQVKGVVFRKNYASYWGWGVYKNSKAPSAAWEFLKFLTAPENNAYYLALTGRPAGQRQLVEGQQQDQKMKVFADQALSAVSWPQPDSTVIEDAFVEMIETQITSDQRFRQTLAAAEAKINSLLRKP